MHCLWSPSECPSPLPAPLKPAKSGTGKETGNCIMDSPHNVMNNPLTIIIPMENA